MRDAALQVLRLVPSPVPEQGPESGEFEVALPCSAPLFRLWGVRRFLRHRLLYGRVLLREQGIGYTQQVPCGIETLQTLGTLDRGGLGRLFIR